MTQRDASKQTRARRINKEFGMRYNIWIGKTRGQEDMCKAQDRTGKMPRWLARDLILSWSNPADIVGDCFAGSGTTGAEARKLGRECWLNDVDPAASELLKVADATPSELAEKNFTLSAI